MLDDVLSGLDNHTERVIFRRLFGHDGYLRRANAVTILVSNMTRQLQQADHVYVMGDDGMLRYKATADLAVLPKEAQKPSKDEREDFDQYENMPAAKNAYAFSAITPFRMNNAEESKSRQIGDRSVYKYYARSIGGTRCLIYLGSAIVVIFFVKFPGEPILNNWSRISTDSGWVCTDIWMKLWAASNDTNPNQDIGKWLGVFAFLVIAGLSSLGVLSW